MSGAKGTIGPSTPLLCPPAGWTPVVCQLTAACIVAVMASVACVLATVPMADCRNGIAAYCGMAGALSLAVSLLAGLWTRSSYLGKDMFGFPLKVLMMAQLASFGIALLHKVAWNNCRLPDQFGVLAKLHMVPPAITGMC